MEFRGGHMHAFPLQFPAIRKRMCHGKRKFSTEQEARNFNPKDNCQRVYLCPCCCMFHRSKHEPTQRYEQEKWWLIWRYEMETL